MEHVERPHQVDVDQTHPLVDRGLQEGFEDVPAGVVHEDVHPTVVLDHRRDCPFQALAISEIRDDRLDAPAG